jgi:methylthioribulose-1-phosphate dehydratase
MAGSDQLLLEGYELLKAFPGIDTHNVEMSLPIFDNTQDIMTLSRQVDMVLENKQNVSVYLIRGHGLYAWGRDMAEALRVVEAAEAMLACEVQIRQIKGEKI